MSVNETSCHCGEGKYQSLAPASWLFPPEPYGTVGETPVVHPHLQQCAGRNPDPGPNGAAFELAQRQRGARRWAPEMPYPVGALSHSAAPRRGLRIIGQGHGIMRVSAKPGLAPIKASAHLAAVIIEDNLPAVDPAGQPGPRDFHLRRFVARHPRVRNRDTPEPRRTEVGRCGHRIHISGLVTHFIRNSRIVRYHERRRASTPSLRRDHGDYWMWTTLCGTIAMTFAVRPDERLPGCAEQHRGNFPDFCR